MGSNTRAAVVETKFVATSTSAAFRASKDGPSHRPTDTDPSQQSLSLLLTVAGCASLMLLPTCARENGLKPRACRDIKIEWKPSIGFKRNRSEPRATTQHLRTTGTTGPPPSPSRVHGSIKKKKKSPADTFTNYLNKVSAAIQLLPSKSRTNRLRETNRKER